MEDGKVWWNISRKRKIPWWVQSTDGWHRRVWHSLWETAQIRTWENSRLARNHYLELVCFKTVLVLSIGCLRVPPEGCRLFDYIHCVLKPGFHVTAEIAAIMHCREWSTGFVLNWAWSQTWKHRLLFPFNSFLVSGDSYMKIWCLLLICASHDRRH